MAPSAVALALVLALGVGCGDSQTADETSATTRKARIPSPGEKPDKPAPHLPGGNPPSLPADTASLDDYHRQGKTDTIR